MKLIWHWCITAPSWLLLCGDNTKRVYFWRTPQRLEQSWTDREKYWRTSQQTSPHCLHVVTDDNYCETPVQTLLRTSKSCFMKQFVQCLTWTHAVKKSEQKSEQSPLTQVIVNIRDRNHVCFRPCIHRDDQPHQPCQKRGDLESQVKIQQIRGKENLEWLQVHLIKSRYQIREATNLNTTLNYSVTRKANIFDTHRFMIVDVLLSFQCFPCTSAERCLWACCLWEPAAGRYLPAPAGSPGKMESSNTTCVSSRLILRTHHLHTDQLWQQFGFATVKLDL